MRIDPAEAMDVPPARPTRKGPWGLLLNALHALAGGRAELLRHSEQPWASITFSGARHSAVLAFVGTEAVAAGEDLIACLPEHEFAIPGQLVADAAVTAVTHSALPEPRLEVTIEVLLLEDR
jgi:hypothetical protein